MSDDDFLKQYESALADQAAANCRVELLKMQAKLRGTPNTSSEQGDPSDGREEFIRLRQSELKTQDIEFLSKRYRSTAEVASYLGISNSGVKRLVSAGTFKTGKDGRRGHRIDPVNVVIHSIDNRSADAL